VNTRKPKQAASVILLRCAEPKGFEIYLTRRPESMPFLGGKYCYPGGSIKQADYATGMIDRCFGLVPGRARKVIGAQFSPDEAMGFWVGAVRELFEEVGVLLAVEESGAPFIVDRERAVRLAKKHVALLNNSFSFISLLESEKVRCDLSSLAYFSHWQTPPQASIRFDTRFFLAALPGDQMPLAISKEVAHSLWLTPDHALKLFERGDLPMIFPTFASLRTLADFETLESVMKEFFSMPSLKPAAKTSVEQQ
jgi:8-oxo-dGTP pyrophosphatase MutT (NUDIX family)